MKNKDDLKLIRRLKSSDKHALNEIFHEYYPRLYDFIVSKISDRDMAKDLMQKLFMKFWQSRSKLYDDTNIKAYLYKSAQNLVIDYYRRSNIVLYQSDEDLKKNEPGTRPKEEESTELNRAIKELPEKTRDIFLLKRYSDFKYEEIAKIFDISIKTVEYHMTKAMKEIKEKLIRSD